MPGFDFLKFYTCFMALVRLLYDSGMTPVQVNIR